MSDATTIWRVSLALGFAGVAAWMKFASGGVRDDKGPVGSRSDGAFRDVGGNMDHSSGQRDADYIGEAIRSVTQGCYEATNRDQSGTNVVNVDFAYHRLVRDMRKRAVDLGIFDSRVK